MKVAVVVLLLAVARWCVVQAALDHKWYSSAPVLPAVVASSEHIADPRCYNHSKMFLRALDNHTLWAVQMLDASVKVPHGILDGSVSHLGHFDQCLAVSVDDLRGQYCLVEMSFRPISYTSTQTVDPYSLDFDPRIHVWEKLKESEDRSRIVRSTLYLGLCMPSSCSPDQLQETLEHELRLLGDREGISFKTRVSPRLCSTEQEPPPWSAGEIAYSCSLGLLIILVAASTWFAHAHQQSDQSSAVAQVLLCFSIQRSMKSLLHVPKTHPGLDFLDIYRFSFIVCVILGHRVLIYNVMVPVSDANEHEQLLRSITKSILVTGPIIVDFFFVASGTLLAYHLLNHLQTHGSVNFQSVIVIRILRLTPIYMTVVFFHATLFYRMGSGPLWKIVVGVERERCQNNWWTNLLYINNYVNANNMCCFQSWYLPVDIQLFLVSLFIVYAIGRRPSWGYTLLAAMSVLSLLVPFLSTWRRRTDALILPYPDVVADLVSSEIFHGVYVRTENRAAPYFIGIIVGLILFKFKDSKFRMGLVPSFLCFAALKVVLFGSFFAAYPFYKPGNSYTPIQAGLYASLSRVVFGFSCGGAIVLRTFGSLGFLEHLAEWKPIRILGRLAFGVYLVHMLGQIYNMASMRSPQQTGAFHITWRVMGDVVFSFALSFLLTVLLESPVRNLEKLVSQRDEQTALNNSYRKKLVSQRDEQTALNNSYRKKLVSQRDEQTALNNSYRKKLVLQRDEQTTLSNNYRKRQ